MQTLSSRHIFIISLVLFGGVFYFANAASIFDITFPIPELGNCADRLACKAYCDDLANMTACVKFAENHGLVIKHENQGNQQNQGDNPTLHKLAEAIKDGGPGGCTTMDECKTFCSNPDNRQECMNFAREHSIVPKADGEHEDKITKLIKAGKKLPGDCKTPQECRVYCSDPANHEECVSFGRKEGLINKDDGDKLVKIQVLMDSGQAPGGCKTKEECQQYCSDSVNHEECSAFAIKAGLTRPMPMNEGNHPMMQEQGMKGPKENGQGGGEGMMRPNMAGPGGCKTMDECRKYCSDPANKAECQAFNTKMMHMNNADTNTTTNERPMPPRTDQFHGPGPGGCMTAEGCKAYCSKPDNADACHKFMLERVNNYQNRPPMPPPAMMQQGEYHRQFPGSETNQPQPSFRPLLEPESMAAPRNFFGAVIKFFLGFH